MVIVYEELPTALTVEFEQFIRPSIGWTQKIRAMRFCRCYCYTMSVLSVRSGEPRTGNDVYECVLAITILAPKTREATGRTGLIPQAQTTPVTLRERESIVALRGPNDYRG
jgi:hypothetical protein